MTENSNVQVLNSVYRGAKVGEQAIVDLLPKTNDPSFISDLKTQEGQYTAISSEAASKLCTIGAEPESVGTAKKAGMKLGVEMNTLLDDETGHLAELMIKGSNMGVINMTRVVNQYPDAGADVLGLAQKLITCEEDNIQRLKAYLR